MRVATTSGTLARCGSGVYRAGLAMSLIDPYIWPAARLERLIYCTALRDSAGDPTSLADQQTYIAALRLHCPSTAIEYGTYAPRIKNGVLVARDTQYRRVCSPGAAHLPPWLLVEEKGSDVNVATHLLLDVLDGRIDAAMVFSNDSDLRVPLEQARLRVPVATINPRRNQTAGDLRGHHDAGAGRHWWRRLRAEDFLANQLPNPVGRITSRPAGSPPPLLLT